MHEQTDAHWHHRYTLTAYQMHNTASNAAKRIPQSCLTHHTKPHQTTTHTPHRGIHTLHCRAPTASTCGTDQSTPHHPNTYTPHHTPSGHTHPHYHQTTTHTPRRGHTPLAVLLPPHRRAARTTALHATQLLTLPIHTPLGHTHTAHCRTPTASTCSTHHSHSMPGPAGATTAAGLYACTRPLSVLPPTTLTLNDTRESSRPSQP